MKYNKNLIGFVPITSIKYSNDTNEDRKKYTSI